MDGFPCFVCALGCSLNGEDEQGCRIADEDEISRIFRSNAMVMRNNTFILWELSCQLGPRHNLCFCVSWHNASFELKLSSCRECHCQNPSALVFLSSFKSHVSRVSDHFVCCPRSISLAVLFLL